MPTIPQWVTDLRAYKLPSDLLPLAPVRTLFDSYSDEALAAAKDLKLQFPEKRGSIIHALQALDPNEDSTAQGGSVIIEAHLGGRDLPLDVSDELLKLGFEPDGFAKYIPEHFNAHATLKFSLPSDAPHRRAQLLAFARHSCETAYTLLNNNDVEAYLELEVYPRTNRRVWETRRAPDQWRDEFPLNEQSLCLTTPPSWNALEASTKTRKRADIHIKLATLGFSFRYKRELILTLCRCGFYHVITWASNDICTAEFLQARDAIAVFNLMEVFFSCCGGASEMTLEYVPGYWRTIYGYGAQCRLAAVPPLVIGLNF